MELRPGSVEGFGSIVKLKPGAKLVAGKAEMAELARSDVEEVLRANGRARGKKRNRGGEDQNSRQYLARADMPQTAGAVGADPIKGNRGAGHYAPRNPPREVTRIHRTAAARQRSECAAPLGVGRRASEVL
jgi:hypothetical protein